MAVLKIEIQCSSTEIVIFFLAEIFALEPVIFGCEIW